MALQIWFENGWPSVVTPTGSPVNAHLRAKRCHRLRRAKRKNWYKYTHVRHGRNRMSDDIVNRIREKVTTTYITTDDMEHEHIGDAIKREKLLLKPKLMVAAAVVFRNRDGELPEVLLLKRPRYGNDPSTWELPGGKIEEGEKPISAMLRELEEETGISGDMVMWVEGKPLIVHNQVYPDKVCRVHTFSVEVVNDAKVLLSDEHLGACWYNRLDINEIRLLSGVQTIKPHILKLLDKVELER